METDIKISSQFLTLSLGGEDFAIEIGKVREVVDFTETTKIPRTPEFMTGVINLRGNIVSVVDLRQRFGLKSIARTANTCIVIIEVSHQNEMLVVGVVADAVQEVLEFTSDCISAPPKIGTKLKREYLQGIGRCDERFVMILDMDTILGENEFNIINSEAFFQADEEIADGDMSTV